MVRDTERTAALVRHLHNNGILATGPQSTRWSRKATRRSGSRSTPTTPRPISIRFWRWWRLLGNRGSITGVEHSVRRTARVARVALLLLTVAACAQPVPGGEPGQHHPLDCAGSSARLLNCEDIDVPHAHEDWYADTPIYVGNEMPIDEVREFAHTLDGFQGIWIDRGHNGWIRSRVS